MKLSIIIIKKVIGIILILVGLAALVTPFSPGSWLIFVGLEFLGFRMLSWDKMKAWFQRHYSNSRQTKNQNFIDSR